MGKEVGKEDQEKIVCRVCHSETTFHAVYEYISMAERRYGPVSVGEGDPGRILYYACDHCSIIFQDPTKFSRYSASEHNVY